MAQEGTHLIPATLSPEEIQVHLHTQPCEEIAGTLSLVGDKWSMLVVMYLAAGPCRFNELRRRIGGVSQRMLTLTLRKLERHGLVNRTVHPTVPPHVTYALTPLGQSLREPVQALGMWVLRNRDRLREARHDYDAADKP